MGSYAVPYVVQRTAQGERSYDVFSRLLNERIVFLGTEIDDGVANVVIAQLLHLESENPERDARRRTSSTTAVHGDGKTRRPPQ